MLNQCGLITLVVVLLVGCQRSQQAAIQDEAYQPTLRAPAYPAGRGPLVRIDRAHSNYHTADGRYAPFARLLRADGCRVEPLNDIGELGKEQTDVLVIAGATPNASGVTFTNLEIQSVADFVAKGGGLLIVADHPPYAGNVAALAAAFQVKISNVAAVELDAEDQILPTPTMFRRSDGRIGDHQITRGRNQSEAIGELASFIGTAFPVENSGVSLFHFGSNIGIMSAPDAPHRIRRHVAGWSQAVALTHGTGRLVVLGEAAMLTVQQPGPKGLNSKQGRDNQQFALNIVRWLAKSL